MYKSIIKWGLQIGFFIFSLGVLAVSILFFNLSTQIPDPHKLMDREIAQTTKIYDRNEKLLYEVHGDIQRTLVPINDIPDFVKQAVIVTEDKDFYTHKGFDFKRMIGATINNLLNRDVYGEGASTITQQLVKNTILTSEKTYTRKIKELILSIELEQIFSKDEILQIYLNEIPFGSIAYGVQAASEIFFDKDVKDLTIAEGAVLAAVIQSPTYYSPYGNHLEELSERHHGILNAMHDAGYIDDLQLEEALNEQIQFKRRQEDIKAPHFVFYVLEELAQRYSQKQIEEGGLKIITTLDLDKQEKAQDIVTRHADSNLTAYNASNAALVSVDPKTGQILAMVGSRDYWDAEHDGNVNVAVAERQPGSSFKPIVYATAFIDKWFPGSTLFDVKTDFGGGYTPNNYDKSFRGPVTIRYAIQNSLNIPAVKILDLVGLEKAIQKANEMGIESLNDPARYGLSLVLGGGEVKLTEMVSAFSVFANNGKLNPITPILKIEDHDGKILEEFTEESRQSGEKEVLPPQVAYLISNVLSDNNSRIPTFGPNSDLYISGQNVAAKTGTTDEYRDGWTLGYTPSVVTGVWAGNNDNTPMNNGPGIYVAAPIWNEYMRYVLDGQPAEEFNKPDDIINITVDKYSNQKPIQGSETVTDIGASWQQPTEISKDISTYRVCKSNGKLADSSIPEELTEEKVFRVIHSEKPDDPNWEQPVQGWAASAGLSAPPPSDKCTIDEVKPTIKIVQPANGSTIKNNFVIHTLINAPVGVEKVDFYFDGNFISSSTSDPYSTTYNAAGQSNGQHFIQANLTDKSGFTASDTVNITISNQADSDLPSVTFVTPANGASLSQAQFPYNIQVNATDQTSGINRVEFKVNSVPIGTTYTPLGSTYALSWNFPGSGNYSITAVAVDNDGNDNSRTINIDIN